MMTQPENKSFIYFTLPFWKRFLFFICVTTFCFCFGSIIAGLLVYFKSDNVAMLRIATILQDLFIFITPAIVTAVIITRLPAKFLAIEKGPSLMPLLLACLALVLAVPAMNSLVAWNESIELPGFLKNVEEIMRQAEANAQSTIEMILGGNSIGAIFLSILIVGVLAGFSEELFYRGTFQRLLSTGGMNVHCAIWIVAIIFSATHLQFYGFFPRLILGAFFGYLLYWTRCLWIPIILHILNNTLYVLGDKFIDNEKQVDFNSFGTYNSLLISLSVVLTASCLFLLYRYCSKILKDDSREDSTVNP